MSRQVRSGRTWSARANTPTASGAAAEVPPCVWAHLSLPTSVVCCIVRKLAGQGIETHNVVAASRARRDDHHGRAELRIVRVETFLVDRSDGDGKDRVGVSVKIALVLGASSVTRGKDKYRSLAIPSLLHPVDHCFQDQAIRRLHRLAVVRWAPRAGVNVILLVGVVESSSFVGVRDGSR